MIEVKLPKIREDVNESLVVIWFVSEGDAVKEGDPLLEIQTEKEVSEVEAEASGTINEIIYKRGESAKVGEVLATINPAENTQETKPEEQKIVENTEPETKIPDDGQKPEEQKITENAEQPKEASEQTEPAKTLRLAPGLRKLARELNVPVESIAGTGRNGKITEKDIRRVAGWLQRQSLLEKRKNYSKKSRKKNQHDKNQYQTKPWMKHQQKKCLRRKQHKKMRELKNCQVRSRRKNWRSKNKQRLLNRRRLYLNRKKTTANPMLYRFLAFGE
nr:biotin/lipoyl-containing protein [Planococcus glaciei]